MASLFDYMKHHKRFDWRDCTANNPKENTLVWESGHLYLMIGGSCKLYEIKDERDLIDFYENDTKFEVRICSVCGKPMFDGFTDDLGTFYACDEDCFEKYMNSQYGEGNWRVEELDGRIANEEGGYYEYFKNDKWNSDGSFYTEWY